MAKRGKTWQTGQNMAKQGKIWQNVAKCDIQGQKEAKIDYGLIRYKLCISPLQELAGG